MGRYPLMKNTTIVIARINKQNHVTTRYNIGPRKFCSKLLLNCTESNFYFKEFTVFRITVLDSSKTA